MTESFAELFEQSQQAISKLKPGSIVTGIVVEIRNDVVVINAGLKSEGIVPIEQFKDESGTLEVEVGDASNFYQRPLIEVFREGGRFVVRVTSCAAVAHAIAAVALELSRNSRPPGLHFGWPELDVLSASWNYLAFGEGNVAWKVRGSLSCV